MPIARAMLIACFTVLGWLAAGVAALLLLLAGLQLLRGDGEPVHSAFAALVALAGAALCRWAAGKVQGLG